MAKSKSPSKKTAKPTSAKKIAKTPRKVAAARTVHKPKYKSFRMQKRIKHPAGGLPGSFRLLGRSLVTLRQHWKLFGLIALVYIVLLIVLSGGLNSRVDVRESRDILNRIFSGSTAQISTGLTLFGLMIGSSASPIESSSAYRSMATIMLSLVMIWALRQVLAGKKATLRDSFYKSMYPLVPFLLVLAVVGLQSLPLALGAALYNTAISAGLAATRPEQFIWIVFVFLLAVLTLYMVTTSFIALYIVTLPDMSPVRALRSAQELVRFRRWTVMRKLLVLPLVLVVFGALMMMPFLLFWPAAAQWAFILLTGLMLLVANTYSYTLYRELL